MGSFRRARTWALTIVVAVGVGAALGQQDPLTAVKPLGGGEPIDLSKASRCLATQFAVAGQALHVSGSTGGMVPLPFVDPLLAGVAPEDPGSIGAPGVWSPPLWLSVNVDQLKGDVTILVADDFGTSEVDAGVPAWTIPESVYDNVAAPVVAETLHTLISKGHLSHGAVVLNHVNAVLAGLGFSPSSSVPSGDPEVWNAVTWTRGSARVQVKGVDLTDPEAGTGTADTNTIATRIGKALDREWNAGVNRVVVNMSWVLLPCATIADFEANIANFQDFDAYLKALAQVNGVALDDLMNGLASLDENDPLRGFKDCDLVDRYKCPPHSWVDPVAASGNFARVDNVELDYSMLPAAWSFILGVGAPPDLPSPSAFANPSNVTERGAWFELTDPAGLNTGHSGATAQVAYAGTSFSAPKVSAYVAVDLLRDPPRCSRAVGDTTPDPRLYGLPVASTPLASAVAACHP